MILDPETRAEILTQIERCKIIAEVDEELGLEPSPRTDFYMDSGVLKVLLKGECNCGVVGPVFTCRFSSLKMCARCYGALP